MPIKKVKVTKTDMPIKADLVKSLSDSSSNPPAIKENISSELNGKMLHIKVGMPGWTNDVVEREINKVEEKIAELFEENNVNCLVLVTHYGVDVRLIEPAISKKVSSLS